MGITSKNKLFSSFRPGEGKTAGILFLQCFLSGFASAFFFITASVSFIRQVSVDRLPLAYMLSGIVGFVLMSIYKRTISCAGALAAYRSSIWVYFFLCVSLFVAFLCCSSNPLSLYVAYLSYLFVMPFSTMSSLGFSTLCLTVFDMGQSKRLLALVSTGDTVAAIGAYLFVPFFTKAISNDTTYLLLLTAGFTLLSLLPLRLLKKRHPRQFRFVPPVVSAHRVGSLFFGKNRFYLSIAIAGFFSVLAIYLADYSYLISVRYLTMQTEWKLTIIVSGLFCVIKVGELVASLLSKTILNSRGMLFSLLVLPASLVFSTTMALLCNSVLSGFPFFLITFLLLGKWSERVIRKGLTAPATRVLYQVAPLQERLKVQTVIEGSLSQLSTVVSGVLLLALSFAYSGAETLTFLQGIAIAGLIAYCCWLLAIWNLFKNYKLKIQKYLYDMRQRNHIPPTKVVNDDAAASVSTAATKPEKKTSAESDWQRSISNELHYLNEREASSFLPLVAAYNPAILMAFEDKDEEWIYKCLVRAYLGNNSFFSCLSIIWYMRQMPTVYTIRFMKEVYEDSNLTLRQQIVLLLKRLDYHPQDDEWYYFMELCHSCAAEVAWMMAARYDTTMTENPTLAVHLSHLIDGLKQLLLHLLAIIHDATVMQEVEKALIHQNGSSENHLFAIELLDSILKAGLKVYVIPLFEEIPFSAMRSKLERIFPINSLPAYQRLKELTMKDFRIIDPATRQLAMEAYFRLTKDEALLQAFATSKLENMAIASGRLLRNIYPDLAMIKANAIQCMYPPVANQPMYRSYLMDTATRFEGRKRYSEKIPADRYDAAKHKAYFFTDDGCLTVDTLGLAMLYKLQADTEANNRLKAASYSADR